MTISNAPFDLRQLRDVYGTFVTGVTVITTRDGAGQPYGVTANSFNTVSLDPPLVLWSQSLNAGSFPAYRDSDHFAVNILAHDQIELSNHFAKSRDDKFKGIACSSGLGDVPVLKGTAAHLECVKVAAYPSGDHMLYIGRVERMASSSRRPLAFSSGRYSLTHSCDLEASYFNSSGVRPVPLTAIEQARAQLPELAEALGGYTLCLSVWGNRGPTALHWEPSSHPVSDQLFSGLVMPVTQSATGLAFAAFLPETTTKPFIDDDLQQLGDTGLQLIQQREALEQQVADVRAQGFARMIGQSPSRLHKVPVHVFSAPISDADGHMIMALTLAAPADRLDSSWTGSVPQALLAAAQRISAIIAA